MSSSASIYFTCARGGLRLVQCLLGLPLSAPPGRVGCWGAATVLELQSMGSCHSLAPAEHHPPLAAPAPCPGAGNTEGTAPDPGRAVQGMPRPKEPPSRLRRTGCKPTVDPAPSCHSRADGLFWGQSVPLPRPLAACPWCLWAEAVGARAAPTVAMGSPPALGPARPAEQHPSPSPGPPRIGWVMFSWGGWSSRGSACLGAAE